MVNGWSYANRLKCNPFVGLVTVYVPFVVRMSVRLYYLFWQLALGSICLNYCHCATWCISYLSTEGLPAIPLFYSVRCPNKMPGALIHKNHARSFMAKNCSRLIVTICLILPFSHYFYITYPCNVLTYLQRLLLVFYPLKWLTIASIVKLWIIRRTVLFWFIVRSWSSTGAIVCVGFLFFFLRTIFSV